MNQPLRKTVEMSPGKIIPAENVRIMQLPQESDAPDATEAAPTEPLAPGHEPEVILLKDGTRVKTIVIKCKCGEVICLDCEY
jgi:hypothetical protein